MSPNAAQKNEIDTHKPILKVTLLRGFEDACID